MRIADDQSDHNCNCTACKEERPKLFQAFREDEQGKSCEEKHAHGKPCRAKMGRIVCGAVFFCFQEAGPIAKMEAFGYTSTKM